ncbi:hypothetical protein [Chondromyces crocatus]|uniref:Uncharacterized protein n=1 Tax=Chondromyces crocatus TaxID=52 RepID=A0A0K1EF51_CHOCO|nr:hypothetical protein [Chondromyces crocatus]AKT39500.1 uncharacterized protein CMC5_036470 [Chondromyces crocatus]
MNGSLNLLLASAVVAGCAALAGCGGGQTPADALPPPPEVPPVESPEVPGGVNPAAPATPESPGGAPMPGSTMPEGGATTPPSGS